MKAILAGAALALTMIVGGAQAASITQFNKTTNDGVYTLSQAQADHFGFSTADRIAFFRIREGNGTAFSDGDTFDATSLANSFTSNGSSILAFLNGTNAALTYTGDTLNPATGAFDLLGTTTVGAADSYYEGVAFLFNNLSGNIVAGGTSTFNGGQTRGDFVFNVAPVPIPAAGPLFLAALGAFGFAARRRRQSV